MPSPDYEAILAQDDWLRRIARSLVRDPDLADELVQDAWVASLQQGERRRPWLVSVLRNVGASRFRAAASLRERARRAAETGPNEADATDEIAADLELRERVAHELRALDEPYRTALHHRFVSDLSVKEIARRTGVAPSTVSERITRGLGRLKSRLDRAYDGDRRTWSSLLLPMARPEGLAALGIGTLAMTTTAKWTLAVAAACGLWFTLAQWHPSAAGPEVVEMAGGDEVSTTRPVRPRGGEIELARVDGPGIVERPRTTAPVPSGQVAAPAAVASPRARIKARFRLPDGRPAAVGDWKLFGWPSNAEAVRTHGLPESWEPSEGQLDASGDVDVAFDAPGAYQFTFDVSSPGCVDASWRWHALLPGESKDLGEVTLRPAARVTGHLVGPDGQRLLEGGWRVTAREQMDPRRPPGEGWEGTWTSAAVETETAAFVIDGVPSGRVALSASSDRFGTFHGPELEVPAAGADGVVFRVDSLVREETSVIVTIGLASALSAGSSVAPKHVVLLDDRGDRTPATRHPGRAGRLVFEDVDEGAKQLVVDDPRFVRVTRAGVRAGDRVRIELRGSATLSLDVRGLDGDPVSLYSVELEVLGRMMAARLHVHDGESPLDEGRLVGVVPGSYRLFVRSGDRSAVVDAVDLRAGETRPLVVRLNESATIRGHATFADGTAAARIRARLVTPAEVDDGPDSFVVSEFAGGGIPEQNRHEVDRKATDESGRFDLAVPGPGRYIVMLGKDSGARSESQLIEVVAGVAPEPLELVAARPARIRGRIDVPAGLDLSGWRVVPHWPGMRLMFQVGFEPAIVNSEASFELPELSPGRFELYLLQPGSGMARGDDDRTPSGGRLMAELTLADGESLERLFPFPGGLPSQVTFEVALTGAPDGECTLQTSDADIFGPSASTRGSTPTLGPLLVDAGERNVTLHGDGWAWVSPAPIAIPEGATTTIALKVDLIAKPVRLTARGEPLAGASFLVQREGADFLFLLLESDAEGVVDLRLAPGTYELSFSARAAGEAGRTLRVDWPLAGDEPTLAVDGE